MQRVRPGRRPRAVRPKDAATLILCRSIGAELHVLMGRRNAGHRFLPDKFVFPGGRVDPADGRVIPRRGLRPEVEASLRKGCSAARARALAMAAIRETFEETGLLVGRETPSPPRTRSRSWAAFLAAGGISSMDSSTPSPGGMAISLRKASKSIMGSIRVPSISNMTASYRLISKLGTLPNYNNIVYQYLVKAGFREMGT